MGNTNTTEPKKPIALEDSAEFLIRMMKSEFKTENLQTLMVYTAKLLFSCFEKEHQEEILELIKDKDVDPSLFSGPIDDNYVGKCYETTYDDYDQMVTDLKTAFSLFYLPSEQPDYELFDRGIHAIENNPTLSTIDIKCKRLMVYFHTTLAAVMVAAVLIRIVNHFLKSRQEKAVEMDVNKTFLNEEEKPHVDV
jgi:hypothetical protein